MRRVVPILLQRAALAILTVVAVILLAGLLIHLVPGDPVTAMVAQSVAVTPEAMAEMRARLGLDLPVWLQALHYLLQVLHGDLGTTIRGGEPVARLLFDRLPNTFVLAACGLALALALGIPLGILAAVKRGKAADTLVMVIAVLGVSIPGFWLGLMLIQLFALDLGWLPVAGSGAAESDPACADARPQLQRARRPDDALGDDRRGGGGLYPHRPRPRAARTPSDSRSMPCGRR